MFGGGAKEISVPNFPGEASLSMLARTLLPDDYLALLPDCNQVKCCLAEIDPDRSDVHVMILLYMLLAEIILRSG